MQQYFDPQQQANMNGGFPGTQGFQANQQSISSSLNGPTPTSNAYMTSAGGFQQNGAARFNNNTASNESGENFDSNNSTQNPPNSQAQMFPANYMDPRMGGFDPRNRPNLDPMSSGMDAFGPNANFPNKMRMNDNMAAFFNNPAAMAALQRQRMGMYGQGRDNVRICVHSNKSCVVRRVFTEITGMPHYTLNSSIVETFLYDST